MASESRTPLAVIIKRKARRVIDPRPRFRYRPATLPEIASRGRARTAHCTTRTRHTHTTHTHRAEQSKAGARALSAIGSAAGERQLPKTAPVPAPPKIIRRNLYFAETLFPDGAEFNQLTSSTLPISTVRLSIHATNYSAATISYTACNKPLSQKYKTRLLVSLYSVAI